MASKELSDYVGSKRFWLFFAIIYVGGISTAQLGIQGLIQAGAERSFLRLFTITAGSLPPFLFFTAYLGPLLGIVLGFDSLNRELSQGTLVRVLSQPIHRDSVINGKFLAGLTIIAITVTGIVGIASGLAIRLGLVPNVDELMRLTVFIVISIFYIAAWMALSQLFSILFKQVSTSAIVSFAVWGFFTFFWAVIVSMVSGHLVSDPSSLDRAYLEQNLSRLSPVTLYTESIFTVLTPTVRFLSPITLQEVLYVIPNPLPVGQSLLLIWPHITGLIALVFVSFLVSYIKFMREEIRA